jgi:hypothetical protein
MKVRRALNGMPIPLHPGAARFFREKGIGRAAGATSRRLAVLELLVKHPGPGPVLHREPVAPGATFALHYRHSSEGIPVRGAFRIDGEDTLTVVESAFGGFGPGLPALTREDAWRIAGGMIVHWPLHRAMAELHLRVTAIARPRLTTPSGRELDLAALAGDRAPVRIRVREPRRNSGAVAGPW